MNSVQDVENAFRLSLPLRAINEINNQHPHNVYFIRAIFPRKNPCMCKHKYISFGEILQKPFSGKLQESSTSGQGKLGVLATLLILLNNKYVVVPVIEELGPQFFLLELMFANYLTTFQ